MATGRIGVTPTLGVRWSKAPTGGTTALSGLDDSSVSLVYSVGYEQVYRNGVLLSRGNDYTATDGTTITLIDATITGDIIEVFAQQLVPLTDAISKGQFTAKGALLSATAASTPGVLAVGANDTVLTADSTTSTGLKWATPAAGGMTLISTTTISNAEVLLSSIPATYNNLVIVIRDYLPTTDTEPLRLRFNDDSTANRHASRTALTSALTFNATNSSVTTTSDDTLADSLYIVTIPDYANTETRKYFVTDGMGFESDGTTFQGVSGRGAYNQTGAISSLRFLNASSVPKSGTILLYGVK